MKKVTRYFILWIICLIGLNVPVFAQLPVQKPDSFFLAKEKGLLGMIGDQISTNPPIGVPQKVVNPFLKFNSKIIRNVVFISLGFGTNINDTCEIKTDAGIRITNTLHKNSRAGVISRNLFFKTGSKLYPYLIADNERYLRQLDYIQDTRISVKYAPGSKDSVDVLVITKDVFSIGGKLAIDSKDKGRVELSEDNISGTGNRMLVSGFYEKSRTPNLAFAKDLVIRNIEGTFINWRTGYRNFRNAFNSGRNEETNFYTKFEKPLVTPFIPNTGSIEFSYHKTSNNYIGDSAYRTEFRYAYINVDGWFGYSLDSKKFLYANKAILVHHFVALRSFSQHFITTPLIVHPKNYYYTDYTGVLGSYNIFKQSFYKTNFVYGYGRIEDVPEGYSIAFTAGYLKKANISRPYTGIDVEITNFNNKGYHSNYTFRAGGYFYRNRIEDVNLLFNLEHFTRLKRYGSNWYQRFFLNTGITAQINPVFNAPLLLYSFFGLPYFANGNISSDIRYTIKTESVFYNTKKILGFRFAPFVFSDLCMLKPVGKDVQKTEIFGAMGGGVRTRNENLVFGTIELKLYYFPRTNANMNDLKISLSSDLQFRYNSGFIKRPDFILSN